MNNYLTEGDLAKLKQEFEYRSTTLKAEIAKEKMIAASFGDRSENAEYKYAKQRYYENNRRIGYLRRMINSAKIIEKSSDKDIVDIEMKVKIGFIEDDEDEEIQLDTTLKADPLKNMVSIESPLGKAIYKKRVGDRVQVESPNGSYTVLIKEIIR